MKNITIETNWVRVIGNTRNPNNQKMNEMIGEECEVNTSFHDNGPICIWDKDKSDFWIFNKSDVRFLIPAMFNEKHLAIDDEVFVQSRWKKVLWFFMYDNKVKILAGTLEDTNEYEEEDIQDHRTETLSLTGKEVDVIVDGATYKAVIK